jgi:hypothetical protein
MSLGFVDWIMKTVPYHICESGSLSQGGIRWDVRTIFVSHTFTDCNTGLLVGVLQDHDLGQLNAETNSLSAG